MFWKAAQNAPWKQQNQTSSEAALETPTACSRRQPSTLQTTRAHSPAGVPAGGCPGTAPFHFSRAKSGRTAPLPPSAAGGSPAPPSREPPPAAPVCSPPLAPPAKRRAPVTKFGSGTEASRPRAAAPTGRRCALPPVPAPSAPLPGRPGLRALRAGCAAAGDRRALARAGGGLPGSVRGGRGSPGGSMELATRSQVRVGRLAVAPAPPRPAFPVRAAPSPPGVGNVAAGPWTRRAQVPRSPEWACRPGVRRG